MIETIGRIYKEKIDKAKKITRFIQGEDVEFYIVAEDKNKMKLLEKLSYIVAYMEDNNQSMSYYIKDGYVYYFKLIESDNYYIIEREEYKDEIDIQELVNQYFHGYIPDQIKEDIKELKKRYTNIKKQLIMIGGLVGGVVILGYMVYLMLAPEEQPPMQKITVGNTGQQQQVIPLNPDEVYKTGILASKDLINQVNQIIDNAKDSKDSKIGTIEYQDDQDAGSQSDKKDYVIHWSYYYDYPVKGSQIAEDGMWKKEDSKQFTYTRNDADKVKNDKVNYICMETILLSYPKNTIVAKRGTSEDDIEIKDLTPSQLINLLNKIDRLNCPIYIESLKIAGNETDFKLKVKEAQ